MTFTERLEELMQKRHIANKSELSRISGIPYTTIDGFYKRSSDNIKLSTLKKLSECLNCSIDYLVGNDKRPIQTLRDKVKKPQTLQDRVRNNSTNTINDKVKGTFDELGVNTIAAHFDGEGYTPDELEKIKEFAAFLKTQSKIK